MDHFAVGDLVEALHVRDVELFDRLDHDAQRFITAASRIQVLPRGAEEPQHLRPIEPLPFAMFAETHGPECIPDTA